PLRSSFNILVILGYLDNNFQHNSPPPQSTFESIKQLANQPPSVPDVIDMEPPLPLHLQPLTQPMWSLPNSFVATVHHRRGQRWMSFSKRPGKNTFQCYTKPLDSLKNWNNRFFWVDERVFPTVPDWRTSAPKDEMPAENTYSPEAVMVLNTHRTPIQKQPEALLCLVVLSDIDLFNLIRAPNPTKVKTGTHPCDAHEVPLLTVTGNGMEDQGQKAVALEVPPPENVMTTGVAPKAGQAEGIAATGPRSTIGGKSLAAMRLGMGSTCPVPTSWDTPVDVSDPDPLSFADPSSKGAAVAGDLESKNTSFTSMVRSPESIYRSEWGVTNGCLLDAPEACQDLVDHIAPPEYFSELRHLHNNDFLKQYNINLAWQARENEIKNLETLLESETDMKKIAEAKNTELGKELENLRALFSDLQGGAREGQLKSRGFEAYGPEAKNKYIVALHALKDLKYLMVDQLESLKDAPIDVIMASLHLESDTGDDAPP
nr:hypothetical protein [Tanacetum cinerariifolium]